VESPWTAHQVPAPLIIANSPFRSHFRECSHYSRESWVKCFRLDRLFGKLSCKLPANVFCSYDMWSYFWCRWELGARFLVLGSWEHLFSSSFFVLMQLFPCNLFALQGLGGWGAMVKVHCCLGFFGWRDSAFIKCTVFPLALSTSSISFLYTFLSAHSPNGFCHIIVCLHHGERPSTKRVEIYAWHRNTILPTVGHFILIPLGASIPLVFQPFQEVAHLWSEVCISMINCWPNNPDTAVLNTEDPLGLRCATIFFKRLKHMSFEIN